MGYKLQIPKGYQPQLNIQETEQAIKLIKDFFELSLSSELRLRRITAPLFVKKGSGINDDLSGVERPVTFPILSMNDEEAEIVHSLAKWKRLALARFEIEEGYGVYTDMNALRPDEVFSNIHSIYVDQWDWERVVSNEERSVDFLKYIVNKIYSVFRRVEYIVYERYPQLKPILPEEITFLHTQELADMYPNLSPNERETEVAKKYGAVFIIGIGGLLSNGEKHDGRAPDYDDWSTESENGLKGLNGDILLWNPILEKALEISSMGIRVDKDALNKQLAIAGAEDRKELMWHKMLLNDELPLSIGGGIGQSRLCMFFLKKAHIGEIQTSIWPDEMIEECKQGNIPILS
ncbi:MULTISPECIES: aspartate--ammonia ligase [Flavobacteriaceae]|uniref:aspartate--ammonia ligase n=1 Tax=Flavobacteriaceae TaxID=49546 RepID=UPI000422CDE5|nr:MULTISPECIES: aspartate--ammonia ligase [Flavobacteriaceae]MDX1279283.1 aspartate--ammonia ligase [Oceanihabitans sediminis]